MLEKVFDKTLKAVYNKSGSQQQNGKGGADMINTNAANFREDLYNVLKQTILFNEPVNISTKDGNAVLISESDYRGLVETLYLTSQPELKEKLIEGMNTPIEDCISEDEVQW